MSIPEIDSKSVEVSWNLVTPRKEGIGVIRKHETGNGKNIKVWERTSAWKVGPKTLDTKHIKEGHLGGLASHLF